MDAVMLVMRMIDIARHSNDDGILALLLDWAKVVDINNPYSMRKTLHRSGLSPEAMEMRQNAGIAHGCLSPRHCGQTVMPRDAFDTLHIQREPGHV
eukprot:6086885-Pyramimonas_sp.AAC.1